MKLLSVFSRNSRRRRARCSSPAIAHESLEPRQMLSGVSVSPSGGATDHSADEILIKFEEGFDVQSVLSSQGELVGPSRIGHLAAGFAGDQRLFEIPLTPSVDRVSLLDHYNALPFVDYAELNVDLTMAAVPNDSQRGTQWALDYVNAAEAWDIATDSSAIPIAIIDSGIQTDHPDLRDNLWRNTDEIPGNGRDDDGNGFVDDHFGYDFDSNSGNITGKFHGTFVAGMAGAVGDNSTGIAGAAWDASLMALQSDSGLNSNVVRSIDYAIANGAKVINASWGNYVSSQAIFDAVRRAESAGVLFVTAAGNDGANLDGSSIFFFNRESDFYPSEYSRTLSNVLTVGSINRSGQPSWFTNYSPSAVQIAAPGEDVLSTVPGSGYASDSGTSFAAPLVAGAAALVWAQDPEMTYLDVKNILLETAKPENLDRFGHGSLDMAAAMRRVRSNLTDARLFNAQLYLDLNPDVATQVGANNLKAARRHWIDHGIDEGRVASTVFDAKFYEQANPVLASRVGKGDYRALAQHWLDYGIAEGRKASTVYDSGFYQARHADLVKEFGRDNHTALLNHWLQYGIREGRRASATFDVRHYQSVHADVTRFYGRGNYNGMLRHWLQYGLREGRESSREFDVAFYLNAHPDLRSYYGAGNHQGALAHFVRHGQGEGRRTNEQFNIDSYRQRYGDLNWFYGRDYHGLWEHWFRHGIREGRDPS